jgi:hypothetical protein
VAERLWQATLDSESSASKGTLHSYTFVYLAVPDIVGATLLRTETVEVEGRALPCDVWHAEYTRSKTTGDLVTEHRTRVTAWVPTTAVVWRANTAS